MVLAAKEKVPQIVQFFGAVKTGKNVCIFMEVLGKFTVLLYISFTYTYNKP